MIDQQLTPERQALVEDNMGLAGMMAKRFLYTGMDYEDLFSLCCIGLVEGAIRFDPERGKFSTCACMCMQHAVLNDLRSRKRHTVEAMYLEDLLNAVDGLNWEGFLSAQERRLDDHVTDVIVLQNLAQEIQCSAKLNAKEQIVLACLLSGEELSQKQIGEVANISQVSVSRYIKTIRKKLERQVASWEGWWSVDLP